MSVRTLSGVARLGSVARARGPIVGRHLLIVDPMDVNEAAEALRKHVELATGENWDEVAQQVARIGYWEFEDYQEHRGAASGERSLLVEVPGQA